MYPQKRISIDSDKNKEEADKIKKMRVSEDYRASGLKHTLHGNVYQLKLLMLFLKRGLDKGYSFRLATEMDDAEKFDDLVFQYKPDGTGEEEVWRFLQAKHKQDESKKISLNDLLTEKDGEFSLQKYFISYCKVKQNASFREGILKNFIICTNIDLEDNLQGSFEQVESKDDILDIKHNSKESKLLQLKIDKFSKKEELISILKDTSDLNRLAKKLAEHVLEGKKIELKDPLFQSYHGALAKDVINTQSKKFYDKFLNNQQLSDEVKAFREIFKKQIEKKGSSLQTIKNEVLKLSSSFGKNDELTKLPNNYITDQKIKEFLEKLVFAVNQPNEVELGKIIKSELGKEFNYIDKKNVYSRFQKKMLNWMKKKEGKFFSHEEGKAFFEKVKKEILGAIWFDVRDPIESFIGRENELNDLHEKLQRNLGQEKVTVISQAVLITGLGGIGKSELVRKYVYDHGQDYDNNIIWINAESETTLRESFLNLAKDNRLGIHTKNVDGEDKSIKSIVEEVYSFFVRDKRKSLFIFDNAEKYRTQIEDGNEDIGIDRFLPSVAPENKPHILITSRNQNWGSIKVLPLDIFTKVEAKELFKKEFNNQDESVEKLIETLQYFPLALQQAIAYTKERDVILKNTGSKFDIDDYLVRYGEETRKLLNFELPKGSSDLYTKTTFTAWKITTDRIKEDLEHGKQAEKILDVMAYLSPENIPTEMFLELEINNDREKLGGAIQLLKQYSMINEGREQVLVDIHRLIQEVIRINLREESKEEKVLKKTYELLKNSVPYDSEGRGDFKKTQQMLPHLETYLSHIDDLLARKPEKKKEIKKDYLHGLLIQISNGYHDVGNYKKQKKLLKRVLPISEEYHGNGSYEVAKIKRDLGYAYGELGDLNKKKEYLEYSLNIIRLYSHDDFKAAILKRDLGNTYGELGYPDKQIELLEEALDVFTKSPNNFTAAVTKKDLGNAYGALGEYQKKNEYLEEALRLLNILKKYPDKHPSSAIEIEIARTKVCLGRLYGVLDGTKEEFLKKRDYLEEALYTFQVYYTYDNAEIARATAYLGNIYGVLDNHQKKIKSLNEALLTLRKNYQHDNMETALILQELSNAYGKLNCPEEKRKHIKKSLDIVERIAASYGDSGSLQKKLELLNSVLKIKEKEYGKDSTEFAKTKKLILQIETSNSYISSNVCSINGGRTKRSIKCDSKKYLEHLRKLPHEKLTEFIRQSQDINDFNGDYSDIVRIQKIRELSLSSDLKDSRLYEIDKLLEDPINRRIQDIATLENGAFLTSKAKQQFMITAGRIQLLRGMQSLYTSCTQGMSRDCNLGLAEMGYSLFLSQPIENGMLKITPKIIKSASSVAGKVPIVGENLKFVMQLKGISLGKPIARGIAGAAGGIFDIIDIARSADSLVDCKKRAKEGRELCSDKEIRDSATNIGFSSVSFISGITLTAAGMSIAGIAVGFVILVGQGVYSGISNIIEYEKKYDTTHNENWSIFWRTALLQDMAEDVEYLAANKEVVKELFSNCLERLCNTDIAAIAVGLGRLELQEQWEVHSDIDLATGLNLRFLQKQLKCPSPSLFSTSPNLMSALQFFKIFNKRECTYKKVKVPVIYSDFSNINMNKMNADTTKISRITPDELVLRDVEISCAPRVYSNSQFEDVAKTVSTAVHPCDNAFVVTNITRMVNHNKNQKIIFDLGKVNDGKIVGSNELNNDFVIGEGRMQIFGGHNVVNKFYITDKGFLGDIYGGNNATNLLDLSYLKNIDYNKIYEIGYITENDSIKGGFNTKNINQVLGRKDKGERITCRNNNEIFVDSGGGYSNSEMDYIRNCKKTVIWPYTKVTGFGNNNICYIKLYNILEDSAYSEVDINGTGTLVFLETALLKDCNKVTYSSTRNILSLDIPIAKKVFTLNIKNYLNQNKKTNFSLIDKHGSNIVPIITESDLKQDSIEIKLFHLNTQKVFRGAKGKIFHINNKEDSVWYKRISQSSEDYKVFTVVQEEQEQSETNYKVFGSKGNDIINLSKDITFAYGGNGSDLYLGNNDAIVTIDNCSEDQELDILSIPQHFALSDISEDDLNLYCSPHLNPKISIPHGVNHCAVKIQNYFKDLTCQHLAIKTEKGTFIPLKSEKKVILAPFYHASNNENTFFVPEDSRDIVIDACEKDIKFYKHKDDLMLIRDKDDMIPLTITIEGFYSNQGKWRDVKTYFWYNDEFSSFNLPQVAANADDYQNKVKNDYEKVVKEYVYYNDTFFGEITHNQQNATLIENEKRIAILILKDINPSRIGLAYTDIDLILFDKEVDHQNLTIRNWNFSQDNRISRIEFNLGLSTIVTSNLDKFVVPRDLKKIQTSIKKATLQASINQKLENLEPDIIDRVKYSLSINSIKQNMDAHKILGFDSFEDQAKFISSYYSQCNGQTLPKNNRTAEALVLTIAKGYNQLSFTKNHSLFPEYYSFRIPQRLIFNSALSVRALPLIVQELKKIEKSGFNFNNEELSNTIDKLVSIIVKQSTKKHQRPKRNLNIDNREESLSSSASRTTSWINTLITGARDFIVNSADKLSQMRRLARDSINWSFDAKQSTQNDKAVESITVGLMSSIVLVGCIAADASDRKNNKSTRYQDLRHKGVEIAPSVDFAVDHAFKQFNLFVEEEVKNIDSEKKREIYDELLKYTDKIKASLQRGFEFSGNVGLDDVLEKCKENALSIIKEFEFQAQKPFSSFTNVNTTLCVEHSINGR